MKKKEPKPFTLPALWTWWSMPYYSNVLLPFKPTHEEWWWAYRGAASQPLTEYEVERIRQSMEAHRKYKITRTRRSTNQSPSGLIEDGQIARITSYAIIREKHPLVLPATMTDEHFI